MDATESRTTARALEAARPTIERLARREPVEGDGSRLRLEESAEEIAVRLADRAVVFEPAPGPEGGIRWTLVLTADGDVIGKFGPFVSVETATERAAALLTSRTTYTVCCDG